MTFTTSLILGLAEQHLLKHPFYQSWSDGTLSQETLQNYAKQYYHHVKAFPRYLSATHSKCENLEHRQFLLQNLVDEEAGEENHPELWARFAEGMGVSRTELEQAVPEAAIKNVVSTFMTAAQSSLEEGLGALFAYEHQIPEIAGFKADALQRLYNVKDARTLQFFDVHRQADVYHTQTLSLILETLPEEAQVRAREAAKKAGAALWQFLDSMGCQAAMAS